MISADILAECKSLAFAIAPELSAVPLYVEASDRFDGLPILRTSCLAWCTQHVQGPIRDRLDWRGEGPLIVLFADPIRGQCGDEYFREAVLQTMVHEVGHAVPFKPIKADLSWIGDDDKIREVELSAMTLNNSPANVAKHEYDQHGKHFVRVASHLWHRAVCRGWDIVLPGLFNGKESLASESAIVCSLMPELDKMRNATFAEILAQPLPEAFKEIWNHGLELARYKGDEEYDRNG